MYRTHLEKWKNFLEVQDYVMSNIDSVCRLQNIDFRILEK